MPGSPRMRIPAQLLRRPFTLEEARASGLTLTALSGRSWRRLGRGLYCWAAWREDTVELLQAWHRRLPGAVFTGLTAAWLHRLDVDPLHPIEAAVATRSGMKSRPGVLMRHLILRPEDVRSVRGLPATTVSRTFQDLRRTRSRVEYLVLADAAMRLGLGRFDELAERAESPMETRLRWLLLDAGLPKPEVQTNLHDASGRFVGRADLYYPTAKLAIEYDGSNHRDRLIEDDRRQNLILRAGYRLLRFTAADVLQHPATAVALVRGEMLSP